MIEFDRKIVWEERVQIAEKPGILGVNRETSDKLYKSLLLMKMPDYGVIGKVLLHPELNKEFIHRFSNTISGWESDKLLSDTNPEKLFIEADKYGTSPDGKLEKRKVFELVEIEGSVFLCKFGQSSNEECYKSVDRVLNRVLQDVDVGY